MVVMKSLEIRPLSGSKVYDVLENSVITVLVCYKSTLVLENSVITVLVCYKSTL